MNHDPRQIEFANLWSSLRTPCAGWATDFLVAKLNANAPVRRRADVKARRAPKKAASSAGPLRSWGIRIPRRVRHVGTPMVCWRCFCIVLMRLPE